MAKILIIGGGAIADSNHIPAAIKLVGVENVVLAEPNEAQVAKMQTKHGLVSVVHDYRDALNEVDACIICTPPHLHNAILRDCIQANKHVLCEKPLSPSSPETKEIIKNATKDLIIGMCHSYRFFPNRREVHRKIIEGFFGTNVQITIHEGNPSDWPTVSGYCFRKDMVPGGVLYDNGIHSMDFALWCLGAPKHVDYSDDNMGGLESNAQIQLTFENGHASLTFSRTIELSNTIIVEGNGHKAVLDVYTSGKYLLDGNEILCVSKGEGQLLNFINAINGTSQLECPIEDGLAVIGLLEQCYAQRKQSKITPNPIGDLQGKTVFVTGGTGFIGGQLIEQLVLHEGAKVRVLIHRWTKAAFVSRFDVEFVLGDIYDASSMIEATKGCDYIMHLAITGGSTCDEAKTNSEKAVDAILTAAKENNIKHVVLISSVVVHGETVPENLTADSPLIPYNDAYAAGKYAAEKRFWEILDTYQLHGSIIRPTYVWGPYSMWYTIDILNQIQKGNFAWVNNGNGICNAVYVGNVVDMCIRCCSEPAADHQAFIATDGEQLTWRAFYGQYMAMIGKHPDEYLSVPLQDGISRRLRFALRDGLERQRSYLLNKYDALEDSSPRLALWLYKAPRKVLRHIRNIVMWHVAEKDVVEKAIYCQSQQINTDKNKEVLHYTPRYSVADGMALVKEWLKQSDLCDVQ